MKVSRVVTAIGLLCFVSMVVLLFMRIPVLHLGGHVVRTYIVTGLLASVGVLAIAIRNFLEASKWMGSLGCAIAIGILILIFYR